MTISIKYYRLLILLLFVSIFFQPINLLSYPASCLAIYAGEKINKGPRISYAVSAYEKAYGTPTIRTAEALYGQEGRDIYMSLVKLNRDFKVLIYDPGLVQRIQKFVKFVEKNDLKKQSPRNVYRAFSQELGTRTFYRGMALTEEQHQFILSSGIKSRLALELISEPRERESIYDRSLREKDVTNLLRSRVKAHVHGSPFISISEIPEVAIAVAVGEKFKRTKNVYLYQIEVPELTVVRLKKGKNKIFSYGVEKIYLPFQSPKPTHFKIRNQNGDIIGKFPFEDSAVESFIFYDIPAHEITDYRLIPENEFLKWN